MTSERKTRWDTFCDYFWEFLMTALLIFILCFSLIGALIYLVAVYIVPAAWKDFKKWAQSL